jgi:hypothetical protein
MNRTSAAPPEIELPLRFQCGASYQWRNAGGHLTVAPSVLTFESSRLAQMIGMVPKITHTADPVTIVHARVIFPLNIGIIVCGEEGTAALSVWAIEQYPRVRRAIISAGFTIEDVKTWISHGEHMARVLTRDNK